MNHPKTSSSQRRHRAQQGFMLIEVLCALLIFSAGILAMVGLQATSVQQASAARFRVVAAMLANDLISRMWASDRTAATLQASFASTSSTSSTNTGYASWYAAVQSSVLPLVASQPPTVTFTTVAGGGSSAVSSSLATITIYWQAPGDTSAHKYVAMAQVK
jgi:type IV pilus assembly protein PilV